MGLTPKTNRHSQPRCKTTASQLVRLLGGDSETTDDSSVLPFVPLLRDLTGVTQRLKCKLFWDQVSWIQADSCYTKPRELGTLFSDYISPLRKGVPDKYLWELRTESQGKQERAINKGLGIMTPPFLWTLSFYFITSSFSKGKKLCSSFFFLISYLVQGADAQPVSELMHKVVIHLTNLLSVKLFFSHDPWHLEHLFDGNTKGLLTQLCW